MFTVAGFYEVQTPSGYTKIAVCADQHRSVQGDDLYVPELNKLAGVCIRSQQISRGRLLSPSLNRMGALDIIPLRQQWQQDIDEDGHWMDLFHMPIDLDVAEALNLEIYEDTPASGYEFGLVWLMNQVDPVPSGRVHVLRATGSTTMVVGTWTASQLTLPSDLPSGRYAVIGATFEGSSIVFGRLIFPGQTWRPGCLGIGEEPYPGSQKFRLGRKGLWGHFEHHAPPQVEYLCRSADTEQVVYLDVIQVRSGRG